MSRYKKVTLISPQYTLGPFKVADHPPVGLGYLAESLRQSDISYRIIDQRLGYDTDDVIRMIDDFQPDLIGLSVMSFQHRNIYETIEIIKQRFPNKSIVVGGPHISTIRGEVLAECKAIDYGVVLEGEETLLELCNGTALPEIDGLIYRNNDHIDFNGERAFCDIKQLPYPRFVNFEMNKYATGSIPLISSRGCPYSCIYCPVEKAIGKKFRSKDPDYFIDEVQHWLEAGRVNFLILDDNFTLNRRRVDKILEKLLTLDNKNIDFQLPNGVRADRIDKEILLKMKDAGFSRLAFGVEAGNDRILEVINKGEKMADIEQAISDSCDLGFNVILFFLIGSPKESFSDFLDSVELAKRYPIEEARFYNLIPFPGTPLFSWVKENDLLIRDPFEYLNSASHFINSPCFETAEMSLAERQKAFRLARKVSSLIKTRALSRDYGDGSLIKKGMIKIFTTRSVQRIYRSNSRLKNLAHKIKGPLSKKEAG